MCGRYVSLDEASIERGFNLVRTEWQFPPSFNVAPTDDVPVVFGRAYTSSKKRWLRLSAITLAVDEAHPSNKET
jgi:putative SOS response-associated peptidase YedK